MPQPRDGLERFAERTDRCEVSLWALRRVVLALVREVELSRFNVPIPTGPNWEQARAETDAALREVRDRG